MPIQLFPNAITFSHKEGNFSRLYEYNGGMQRLEEMQKHSALDYICILDLQIIGWPWKTKMATQNGI